MARADFKLVGRGPAVVGSFGCAAALRDSSLAIVQAECDIAEIRLDLLAAEGAETGHKAWQHLAGFPLLFTARRQDEGGALALDAKARLALLGPAIAHASLIDVEVASISEMSELLDGSVPWVASMHDFEKPPQRHLLEAALQTAVEAGAACFKVAAMMRSTADIVALAEFQSAAHAIPVATMGMGPLAPVSRLLCAQYGSVLNYGFIGATPTAPGQWDAALLKRAIARSTIIASSAPTL